MNILMRFLLLLTVLLKNVNGAISFDIHAFALAHPCVWSICEDLPSEQQNYSISCCILQVPLNYAKPNESSISISMIRLTPLRISTNFLFVLSGGPGEAGLGLLSLLLPLIPAEYGITIIVPDHRGTGYSTVLGCNDQNSQSVTIDCITYLKNRWTIKGLNQFTTTAAAHDLAIQIQAARLTGEISILGVSYGTYWLNRFLVLYPNLVQTAVMDSPVNPLMHSFSMYNIHASSIALQFLSHCSYQIKCIENFPQDSPVFMLRRILRDIDSNQQSCINQYFKKYNLTSEKLKTTFFTLFRNPITDGTVLPAIIFRLNRCNKADVSVLDFFFQTQQSSSLSEQSPNNNTDGPVMFSNALHNNIAFSELWRHANQPDVNQQILNAWQDTAIIAPELLSDYVALKDAWPQYSRDEHRFHFANSSIMMINGQLDSATPLDFAAHLASITGKSRTFYTIPLGGHIVLIYVAQTGHMCPLHLMLSWAFPSRFPSEWSDPACIEYLPIMIDFVGETEFTRTSSLKLLNTRLPFGNITDSELENQASSYYSTVLSMFIYMLPHIHLLNT